MESEPGLPLKRWRGGLGSGKGFFPAGSCSYEQTVTKHFPVKVRFVYRQFVAIVLHTGSVTDLRIPIRAS